MQTPQQVFDHLGSLARGAAERGRYSRDVAQHVAQLLERLVAAKVGAA